MKKPRAGELMDVCDVRSVLYDLLNELVEMKNEHSFAWQQHPDGHRMPCRVCADYEMQKQGVRRALRKFGAQPRR